MVQVRALVKLGADVDKQDTNLLVPLDRYMQQENCLALDVFDLFYFFIVSPPLPHLLKRNAPH